MSNDDNFTPPFIPFGETNSADPKGETDILRPGSVFGPPGSTIGQLQADRFQRILGGDLSREELKGTDIERFRRAKHGL